MSVRWLTALPVYNEAGHVDAVLDEVSRYSREILVVNDGSTDGTGERLAARHDIHVVTHESNRGYGAGLRSAFEFAIRRRYDYLVTIDCDGQHEPQRIPSFVAACRRADIVSGSRYLKKFSGDSAPPEQRRWINRQITGDLNELLGLRLTDAFCGFKAYRVEALRRLQLVERQVHRAVRRLVDIDAVDYFRRHARDCPANLRMRGQHRVVILTLRFGELLGVVESAQSAVQAVL